MAFLSHAIQVRENIRYGAERYRYRTPGHDPILLIHTVEGAVSYRVAAGHQNPPHLWYSPRRRELFQTMDLSGPARALLAVDGMETNHRGPCFQVEIEGFARDVRFWPDSFYRNFAQDVVTPLEQLSRGIYGQGFVDGPTSTELRFADEVDGLLLASTRSPLRLTRSEWQSAHGIVGHQHVPGNSHWDPGAFDMERLLSFVDVESLAPREIHLNASSNFVMRGNDVTRWQQLLIALGHDLSPWGPDGRFGATTDTATREFQRSVGRLPNGVVTEVEVRLATDALARRETRLDVDLTTPPDLRMEPGGAVDEPVATATSDPMRPEPTVTVRVDGSDPNSSGDEPIIDVRNEPALTPSPGAEPALSTVTRRPTGQAPPGPTAVPALVIPVPTAPAPPIPAGPKPSAAQRTRSADDGPVNVEPPQAKPAPRPTATSAPPKAPSAVPPVDTGSRGLLSRIIGWFRRLFSRD